MSFPSNAPIPEINQRRYRIYFYRNQYFVRFPPSYAPNFRPARYNRWDSLLQCWELNTSMLNIDYAVEKQYETLPPDIQTAVLELLLTE